MPPRRTTYQSGRVGMVGIPSVDFSQYKAQAGVFSDLERRLNTVTDFAIKAGTVEAENRAVTNVFENEVLANTERENLEGMSRKDFYDMIGGEGSNAYFQKSKEVALSIITNNLNTSYTKQLEDEYASAVEQGTTPEEFYNNAYGIMQGNIDALEEIDRNTALSFGTDANKALSATYKKYNSDYLKQQKIIKTEEYFDTINPDMISTKHDPENPTLSYTAEMDDLQTKMLSLGFNRETIDLAEKNINQRWINGIADTIRPLNDLLYDNPDLLIRYQRAIESGNKEIINSIIGDLITQKTNNDPTMYDDTEIYTDAQATINSLFDYTSTGTGHIQQNQLYEILIKPVYDDIQLKNTRDTETRILQKNIDKSNANIAKQASLNKDITADVEKHIEQFGANTLNYQDTITKIDQAREYGFIQDSPKIWNKTNAGIIHSGNAKTVAELAVQTIMDNDYTPTVGQMREAGVKYTQADYPDDNERLSFSSDTTVKILGTNYTNNNEEYRNFYQSGAAYIPPSAYAFIASENYAPDFDYTPTFDRIQRDPELKEVMGVLENYMYPAYQTAKDLGGLDFNGQEWWKNNQALFSYYKMQTPKFKELNKNLQSNLFKATAEAGAKGKKDIEVDGETVKYADNLIFTAKNPDNPYTTYIPIDSLRLDVSLVNNLRKANTAEESYAATSEMLDFLNTAIDNIGEYAQASTYWQQNPNALEANFEVTTLRASLDSMLEYYLRLQADLEYSVSLFDEE